MKRLSIVMLVVLCTGCSFHHRTPLYKDYQRISVGSPPPPDIKNNTDWGGENDPNASKADNISESAEYQLANDGNVIAKWYDGSSMDKLPFLWLTWRERSEGELLLNLDPAVEYKDSDIRKEIVNKYIDINGEYAGTDDLELLLKRAMDKGGLINENFYLKKFEINQIFPLMESSLWRISRTSSGSYYLSLDRRFYLSYLVYQFD